MVLTKYKLGELIKLCDTRNTHNTYFADDVKGIATSKEFIATKADMDGVGLSAYKVVRPKCFAYVPDTSRRGDKISLAFNSSTDTYIVSSISIVFEVVKPNILLSDYLFMFYNRPEFDRYSRFHSWGSARETFDWDAMCDMEIELPPIEAQQKYVDIYNAMVANQKAYEKGLDDLKLVCDGYIEDLRCKIPCEKIGGYIEQSDLRNENNLPIDNVRGITTAKTFIATKADMDGVELHNYKIVPPNYFAYVPDTSRRGDKVSLALNKSNETYLVSSISLVFKTNVEKLLPEFLMLFLARNEFDRYARFNSWGSARETFDWLEMCNVAIPITDIKIQQSIVDIYNQYITRKEINEKLKAQIKDLCPILIKGSLQEAQGENYGFSCNRQYNL